jgi:hypothetical protein
MKEGIEDKKTKGLYIKLTNNEVEVVKRIKKNYSINLSQYLRNQIVKLGEKLKSQVGKEL